MKQLRLDKNLRRMSNGRPAAAFWPCLRSLMDKTRQDFVSQYARPIFYNFILFYFVSFYAIFVIMNGSGQDGSEILEYVYCLYPALHWRGTGLNLSYVP